MMACGRQSLSRLSAGIARTSKAVFFNRYVVQAAVVGLFLGRSVMSVSAQGASESDNNTGTDEFGTPSKVKEAVKFFEEELERQVKAKEVLDRFKLRRLSLPTNFSTGDLNNVRSTAGGSAAGGRGSDDLSLVRLRSSFPDIRVSQLLVGDRDDLLLRARLRTSFWGVPLAQLHADAAAKASAMAAARRAQNGLIEQITAAGGDESSSAVSAAAQTAVSAAAQTAVSAAAAAATGGAAVQTVEAAAAAAAAAATETAAVVDPIQVCAWKDSDSADSDSSENEGEDAALEISGRDMELPPCLASTSPDIAVRFAPAASSGVQKSLPKEENRDKGEHDIRPRSLDPAFVGWGRAIAEGLFAKKGGGEDVATRVTSDCPAIDSCEGDDLSMQHQRRPSSARRASEEDSSMQQRRPASARRASAADKLLDMRAPLSPLFIRRGKDAEQGRIKEREDEVEEGQGERDGELGGGKAGGYPSAPAFADEDFSLLFCGSGQPELAAARDTNSAAVEVVGGENDLISVDSPSEYHDSLSMSAFVSPRSTVGIPPVTNMSFFSMLDAQSAFTAKFSKSSSAVDDDGDFATPSKNLGGKCLGDDEDNDAASSSGRAPVKTIQSKSTSVEVQPCSPHESIDWEKDSEMLSTRSVQSPWPSVNADSALGNCHVDALSLEREQDYSAPPAHEGHIFSDGAEYSPRHRSGGKRKDGPKFHLFENEFLGNEFSRDESLSPNLLPTASTRFFPPTASSESRQGTRPPASASSGVVAEGLEQTDGAAGTGRSTPMRDCPHSQRQEDSIRPAAVLDGSVGIGREARSYNDWNELPEPAEERAVGSVSSNTSCSSSGSCGSSNAICIGRSSGDVSSHRSCLSFTSDALQVTQSGNLEFVVPNFHRTGHSSAVSMQLEMVDEDEMMSLAVMNEKGKTVARSEVGSTVHGVDALDDMGDSEEVNPYSGRTAEKSPSDVVVRSDEKEEEKSPDGKGAHEEKESRKEEEEEEEERRKEKESKWEQQSALTNPESMADVQWMSTNAGTAQEGVGKCHNLLYTVEEEDIPKSGVMILANEIEVKEMDDDLMQEDMAVVLNQAAVLIEERASSLYEEKDLAPEGEDCSGLIHFATTPNRRASGSAVDLGFPRSGMTSSTPPTSPLLLLSSPVRAYQPSPARPLSSFSSSSASEATSAPSSMRSSRRTQPTRSPLASPLRCTASSSAYQNASPRRCSTPSLTASPRPRTSITSPTVGPSSGLASPFSVRTTLPSPMRSSPTLRSPTCSSSADIPVMDKRVAMDEVVKQEVASGRKGGRENMQGNEGVTRGMNDVVVVEHVVAEEMALGELDGNSMRVRVTRHKEGERRGDHGVENRGKVLMVGVKEGGAQKGEGGTVLSKSSSIRPPPVKVPPAPQLFGEEDEQKQLLGSGGKHPTVRKRIAKKAVEMKHAMEYILTFGRVSGSTASTYVSGRKDGHVRTSSAWSSSKLGDEETDSSSTAGTGKMSEDRSAGMEVSSARREEPVSPISEDEGGKGEAPLPAPAAAEARSAAPESLANGMDSPRARSLSNSQTQEGSDETSSTAKTSGAASVASKATVSPRVSSSGGNSKSETGLSSPQDTVHGNKESTDHEKEMQQPGCTPTDGANNGNKGWAALWQGGTLKRVFKSTSMKRSNKASPTHESLHGQMPTSPPEGNQNGSGTEAGSAWEKETKQTVSKDVSKESRESSPSVTKAGEQGKDPWDMTEMAPMMGSEQKKAIALRWTLCQSTERRSQSVGCFGGCRGPTCYMPTCHMPRYQLPRFRGCMFPAARSTRSACMQDEADRPLLCWSGRIVGGRSRRDETQANGTTAVGYPTVGPTAQVRFMSWLSCRSTGEEQDSEKCNAARGEQHARPWVGGFCGLRQIPFNW
ncbi:hypothetical protein CBR_g46679 [Chara braunii]|uniref:Uncharacterized protein n=1 Tax=Chara braunii TaxID=69332 RepID=A0A388M0X4_CHABU|nr:hypothetical protein CBR_g46679 [Chara braunii]|eukprot:GBG88191.1 hypothetical protein CBR_g46679 [Chara braunii]